jgi:phage repressor protein C with HTH and peptisase S24 domain
MNDRINIIIRNCIGNHHGAHSVFAERLGARPGLIGDWLSGRSKPKDYYRNKIREAFNISRTWLDTGEGEMAAQSQTQKISSTAVIPSEREIGRLEGENKALRESMDRYEKRLDRYDNEIYGVLKTCAEKVGGKNLPVPAGNLLEG